MPDVIQLQDNQTCVSVTIPDDDILEDDEIFIISLSPVSDQVFVTIDTESIDIIDRTSELKLAMQSIIQLEEHKIHLKHIEIK